MSRTRYSTLAIMGLVLAIAAVAAIVIFAGHAHADSAMAGIGLAKMVIAPVIGLPAADNASSTAILSRAQAIVDGITNDMEPARVAAAEAEHSRLLQYADMVRRENLSLPDVSRMSPSEISAAILGAQVAFEQRSPTNSHVHAELGQGGGGNRIAAMGEGLFARLDPSHTPSPEARQFVGMRISDLAREALRNSHQDTGMMGPAEMIGRALHTTSDFPLALGNTVGLVIQKAYRTPPSGLKAVARKSSAPDFRAKTLIKFSSAAGLEKVNEAGEFKNGTFEEGAESYRISTWGKIFGISRQALVNDQLGVFTNVPRFLAAQAATFEAQFLTNLLVSNPVMSDGKTLFHADHSNLGTAAALNEASLSAARVAMRRQVGLVGDLISVTPRYIVVPSELETTAEKLVASIRPTNTSDVNVFASKLEVVVEPRLTDPKAWYICASFEEVDGLEYAYLEGDEGVSLETNWGFRIDGLEMRARLDYGAGFVEHRGWYKNPGI